MTHRLNRIASLAAAVALAGSVWLAWQVQPALALAGVLGRVEAGAVRGDDLDAGALAQALRAGIEPLARAEAEQQARDAKRLAAMSGVVAGFYTAATAPALLVEPVAPGPAAVVKRTQLLLGSPAPVPEPRPPAEATALFLSTPAGMTALIHAAMARAPETWPGDAYARLDFVRSRLSRPDADTARLALIPSGFAPFWQSRLTVLEFRRQGFWRWRLSAVTLPPSSAQARSLLDAAEAFYVGINEDKRLRPSTTGG